MTWPKKRQIQIQRQREWQRQIHLESTFKEWSQRLVTFETFDQGDEERWPDQKNNDKYRYKDKDKDNDKDIQRAYSKSEFRDLWPLQHLIRVMRRDDQTKNRDNYNDIYRDKDKYI